MKIVEDKNVASRISKVISKLPSDYLKDLATTIDLKMQWVAQKKIYQLLAFSLRAKFGYGGGNPAKDALEKGLINQSEYNVLTALVDMEASLFSVYQTAWTDINRNFKHFSDAPKTEIELYAVYFQETIDNAFLSKVKGEKHSTKSVMNVLNLLVEKTRNSLQNPENISLGLSVKNCGVITKLQPNVSRVGQWHGMAYAIALEAATTDPAIKRALRTHHYYVGEVCRHLLASSTKSTQWSNGFKKHPYKKEL